MIVRVKIKLPKLNLIEYKNNKNLFTIKIKLLKRVCVPDAIKTRAIYKYIMFKRRYVNEYFVIHYI